MINSEGIIELNNVDKVLSNTITGIKYGTENLEKAKEISIAVDKIIELSRINLDHLKLWFPEIIVALSQIEIKINLLENKAKKLRFLIKNEGLLLPPLP